MHYRHDLWVTERWETDRRYYVAEVMQDLFGKWLLKRTWGGLQSRRGSSLTLEATDYPHALALLEDVNRRRQARGYSHV